MNILILNENSKTGDETGAGIMRNRCSFTSRDMGRDWPEAFTYAIVSGWDDAMDDIASQMGWDSELVAFLADAHERFRKLPDRTP